MQRYRQQTYLAIKQLSSQLLLMSTMFFIVFSFSHVARAEETAAADAAAEATPDVVEDEKAPVSYTLPDDSETFEFEAEVHKMLDIVVNSLYQNKDVFLRELISNASDALDKIRFLGLTKSEMLADKEELEVRIQYDKDAKTLTVTDSGIGMTKDDLVQNLGTVARSGTTKFVEALSEGTGDINMIGQFGVGFYSSFLVADRVTVASKHPDDPVQHLWESINGDSAFHVADDPRGNTLGRGTEITLHLKEDAFEYADNNRLENLVKHYSEFVMHPIHLRTVTKRMVDVEEEEEEDTEGEEKKEEEEDDLEVKDDEDADEDAEEEEKPKKQEEITEYSWTEVNTNPAIWTRDKDEIKDDEYQSFYKVLAKDSMGDAKTWIHFNAEGNINFKSLLYLPDEIPPQLRSGNIEQLKGGLKLYVRKVLISDEFELMPRYLAFLKGVVDSDDLPLNVNRETLQESKIIQVIKKKLTRKAIEMIRKLSQEPGEKKEEDKVAEAEVDENGNVVDAEESTTEDKPPPYLEWYSKFGPTLKMGVIEDDANRSKLLKLLRFKSSKAEGDDDWISFEDYVGRMKEWQDEIYIFAGTNEEELSKSQFMERFKEKDVEVIYLTEPIDEYMISHAREFDGKKFTSITKENLKFKDEDEDLVKRRDKAYRKQFKPLTKWLKTLFGNSVMRVAISKRLGSAPAIVSSAEWGHSANMERIMRAQAFAHGQDESQVRAQRILEINPRHPLIHKLLDGCPPEEEEKEGEDTEPFVVDDATVDAAWMLFDMAMLNGGFPIEDSEAYSKRITRALQTQMGLESLDLEDEIDPPEEEEEAPEVDMDGTEGINIEDFNLDDLDMDDV